MSNTDRRLAAIMFTDIVGYTRLTQAKESLALELLEEHRKIIRPLLSIHGGTEIKTMGDAFLVEFKSALEAVLCAAEIQKKLTSRNLTSTGERILKVRVGVHLGDVVHGSGDVYGDAVNIASRIEPLAEPGGVCISQQVYDNIRNKSELEITKMGEVELKNVDLPMAVYKVNLESPGGVQKAQAPRERLAVLPFVNISPDPNDEYFADGLTEELISKLSEIQGLKVIARTSVMNYKKKEKSVSQIGKELEVGSIIEGSVRKAGNKIRVTVQLVDSGTEEHLWASNYDKELDDIFAIQSDVAQRVASSVAEGVFAQPKKKDTENVEAYTLYLRAMQLQHESLETSLRKSVELLDRAVAIDPAFTKARAGLSMSWQLLGIGGYEDFGVAISHAEPEARAALKLDPTSAEAHSAMAFVANMLDRFDEAAREAERAIRINPNLADAHLTLGIIFSSMGDLSEGLASLEKAHELDPLSVRVAGILALVYRVAGRIETSIEVLERMNELSPRNTRIFDGLAESYMFKQDFAKAQDYLDKGLQVNPREPILRLNQGVLYALTGRRGDAERIMNEIERDAPEAPKLYGQLFINSALGNLDEAARVLKRMTETHSWPFLIASLPIFAELRKDPRYLEFCDKVGLLRPSEPA